MLNTSRKLSKLWRVIHNLQIHINTTTWREQNKWYMEWRRSGEDMRNMARNFSSTICLELILCFGIKLTLAFHSCIYILQCSLNALIIWQQRNNAPIGFQKLWILRLSVAMPRQKWVTEPTLPGLRQLQLLTKLPMNSSFTLLLSQPSNGGLVRWVALPTMP